MSSQAQTELEAFHRFIGEQLTDGGADLSPEATLELWQTIQRQRDEANKGIRRGLDDVQAGRGEPLGDYAQQFRNKNNIPHDAG